MHSSGNTNNVNEGFNSGFAETVGLSHPNLHILSNFLSRELKKAMNDVDILATGGTVRPASAKYVALAERRMKLMTSYSKQELSRRDYLIAMGALSWKQSHEKRKFSRKASDAEAQSQEAPTVQRRGQRHGGQAPAQDLDDYDETRVITPVLSEDSDAEMPPDLFPQRRLRALKIAPAHEAREKAKKSGKVCSKCGGGFMETKNTWLLCTGPCGKYFHKRCLKDDRYRRPFSCFSCLPNAVLEPGKEIVIIIFSVLLKTFPISIASPETPASDVIDQSGAPPCNTLGPSSARHHGNTLANEARLPAWDEDIEAMDRRLEEVGFRVSPTQPRTRPDGGHGIWGILGK